MKILFKIFIIAIITITSATAQIRNTKKINLTKKVYLPKDRLNLNNQYLNLETIKSNIKSRKKCYNIDVSSTAIIPPKYPKYVKSIDAYYSARGYVFVELNYLRTNGLLLRSDVSFSKFKGNNYEVLIYPESNNKKKIDKNRIKITWHMPDQGVQTFNLRHVSIQYKTYGILIIGDYDINGVITGVSISLTPTNCLI